jgi:hypothetical protein
MSYPRNAASPPRIEIGAVVQISDGAVQTSGVSVAVRVEGGAETAGGGTVSYGSLSGIVYYTPTQAETDYTAFVVVAYKTGCIPASKSIVTSASATAGYSGVDWGKLIQATSTVNLSGTTISTTQAVASVSGAVGSVTGAVGSVTGAVGSVTARVTANTDQWGGVAVTGMPMPTYTQPTGFLAATFPATVSSFAGGAVASVTGSVGSISGVTFPTHFANLEITANGHVSAVVQSIANNSITASSIQGGAITAAKFAADAITASALAADAVTEIQSGLALAADLLIVSDRVSYSLAVLVGACSDAQTAAETYTLSIGGNTFTVDYTGLDSSGNRSTTTLSKV